MKHLLFYFFLALSLVAKSQNEALLFTKLDMNAVEIPDHDAINLTNEFTIQFWLKPSQTAEKAVILQEGWWAANFSYSIQVADDSTMRMGFNCSGSCTSTNVYRCDTKVLPGECVHITLVYSATGVRFYYDGILQTGDYTLGGYCGNLLTSSEPLRLGYYKFLGGDYGFYYDGLVDELRLWNTVLTDAEILENYNSSIDGDEAGLVLYYDFNEDVIGPGMTITNNAITTGSVLSGLTYSDVVMSPVTATDVCFDDCDTSYHIVNPVVTICEGDSVEIFGEVVTESGLFSENFITVDGCDSLVNQEVIMITVDTSVTPVDGLLTADFVGGTYQWIDCSTGLEISGANSQFFNPPDFGYYAVIVNNDGCSDTSSCYSLNDVGIESQEKIGVHLYPNPANSYVQLVFDNVYEDVTIGLIDVQGKIVLKENHGKSKSIQLDISDIKSGVYCIQINSKYLTLYQKLIVN